LYTFKTSSLKNKNTYLYDICVNWTGAEDHSDDNDDTRSPIIDDEAQSKSKFRFMEKEVLVEFLNGFKIQC
jgi:hypothetical protein